MGPMASLMPHSATMCRARLVACCRSLLAPVVTLLSPKISSSATLPPMHTSSLARSCSLLIEVSSFSGICVTIPRALPLGMMVALCTGRAASVYRATIACPDSWYAVSFFDSSLSSMLFLSAPIRILSLLASMVSASIESLPSLAAAQAAVFKRLYRSAPENPTDPLAMAAASASEAMGLSFMYSSRISFLPL